MKKFRVAFIITAVLAIVAVFLVLNNHKGNMHQLNNEFAVDDTANITKIFLADKGNRTVKLERLADGAWKLNDKYAAHSESVGIMLKTLISLDVKSPVAKKARNNIILMMAGKSVKVEIYQRVYTIRIFDWIKLFPHEKKTKTYYVGDATMDNMGTFMLMEGSEDPYIVYIPGFRGFVSSRYSAFENDWRDHAIFNSKLPDIKKVTMEYPETPQFSFSVSNGNNRNFTLEALSDNKVIQNFDTIKVIQFLGSFRNVNFEGFLTDMDKKQQDSVLALPPTVRITLDDNSGKKFVLNAWHRKASSGEVDIEGNPMVWDRDRMFAKVEGTNELVSIQFFVFDRILKPITWFTDKTQSDRGLYDQL